MARKPTLSARSAPKDDDFQFPEPEGEENEDFQLEIEEEDDTPPEDRGREPMPEDLTKELDEDELEDYSEKVKVRLKQYKKVWHDERRAKERESREKTEAVNFAQKMLEENRRLKSMTAKGEINLLDSYKHAANADLATAKREYKEAYDEGDADKIVAAQEKLTKATYRLAQLDDYVPSLQEDQQEVDPQQQTPNLPEPDAKTLAWQKRNEWYGTDPEMTASALGLHQKLIMERGAAYAGTDDYWKVIDTTMARRFPEYYGDAPPPEPRSRSRQSSQVSVVAPASRSRSTRKVTLSSSQLSVAKKLGLTPEQYAAEVVKLGNE